MIVIHHLLTSQSERIIWLMEELALPYTLLSYPREPTMMAPAAFRKLHPIGQAPVIQDGDIVLAESLAIMTYILELYGEGRLRILAGQPGFADYIYWFHYSVGGLMPRAMQHMASARMPAAQDDPRADAFRERFAWHLQMIDARVETNAWLAGDTFTAADIACHFPFGTMSHFAPVDLSPYPNIRGWLTRISARPAYQRAMRAAGHEEDPALPNIARSGTQ
jgi:glutathione S-transferase